MTRTLASDGGYWLLNFLAICQFLKNVWGFEILLNTGPYGLVTPKRYFTYSFYPISAKLHGKYPGYEGNPANTSLVICEIVKRFVTLLTWESMGNPKM